MTAPTDPTATTPTDDSARDDTISQWQLLVDTQAPVASCRRPRCGGTLRALPPTVVGGLVWLDAECDTCHAAVGLPDGRRSDTPRALRPVQPLAGADAGGDWRARQAKDLH